MDDIRSILPKVIKGFEDPEKQKRSLLIDSWASIAGEKLAKKTHPQLSSKGILYIHVDDSVLAFEISQKYRASFLKRAQAALGEAAVKEVRVLVGK
ncbi:MAG TPA: DciA family protein [Candidatus Omnitrophota bacterium]|nr:DciA family protein [Candidatus Omnitrophota bacterium]HRY85712.1 DciA family protein [Candidatus Omnitrophota bacterium]